MAHRTSIPTLNYAVTHRSPLHLRTTISRTRHNQAVQVRTLWWWSRHGDEWSSSYDEGLEERARRHQRVMRHRYAKALRRRGLWEVDPRSGLLWPWRMGGKWLGGQVNDVHIMSGSDSHPKTEQGNNRPAQEGRPWETIHKDFGTFKQAVDKAIDRDPHGTLFGRHIQSPPSANNSSWTSFSWFLDPKEIRDAAADRKQKVDFSTTTQDSYSSSTSFDSSAKATSITSTSSTSRSDIGDGYEFDPISMRKVPKGRGNGAEPAKRKTLFEALFSEHGCSVPVKPYVPKVYGYSPDTAIEKAKTETGTSTTTKKGFESSRKRELQTLMAATLGNTMDTTAEYYGKYKTGEEPQKESPPARRSRDSPEPNDETPLFSGTTYESKSDGLLKSAAPRSEWLRKEGFKSDAEKADSAVSGVVAIPVKIFNAKIEPSLDRMSSKSQSPRPESTPLRPVLDRQPEKIDLTRDKERSAFTKADKSDNVEDLDYLRASDVRAATRSSRVSKQELENAKQETREKLEADFVSRQKQSDESSETQSDNFAAATKRLAKSLTNVWNHVQEYPNGIVAKTMRSMRLTDNFKKYTRFDRPLVDSTEKLVFKDESLSKVSSIYKSPLRRPSKPVTTFTPSADVLSAERQSKERTATLQRASQQAKAEEKLEDSKASDLAKVIRNVYEHEYGNIDVNHRQLQGEAEERMKASTQSFDEPSAPRKDHPLTTATPKAGVSRDPAVENHIFGFEPTFASLVDRVKDVRRELHLAQQHLRVLKRRQLPIDVVKDDVPGSEATTEGIGKDTLMTSTPSVETDSTAQNLQEAKTATRPTVLSSSAAETPSQPRIQPPVFTPAQSNCWNDEKPPPVVELRKSAFTSSYVILAYNPNTNKVEASPLNMPESDMSKASNPMKLLAGLNHASEFLKFFQELETANYELFSGSGDILVFQKIPIPSDSAVKQPGTTPASESSSSARKEAATVLDQIPAEVNPSPGPAAPTAPPTPSPFSKPTTPPIPSSTLKEKAPPRIRRQESVFSGTIRHTPNPNTPISSAATPPPYPYPSSSSTSPLTQDEPWVSSEPPRDGIFKRTRRFLRRVFLTAVAMGGGAYLIGVVAEGLGAQAQQSGEAGQGPRKKIVMTGQRPGIYSTESSR